MDNIYKQAIDKFGELNQMTKATEEMAELIKEICKIIITDNTYYDYSNIQEEIADVEIMLEQLKIIFDCHDIIDAVKEKKLDRLKGLIENDWGKYN